MSAVLPPGAVEWLLAFADDEHLIGQQHTEWIGVAPFLEEDLAFCSIAQDELGHAAGLYDVVGDADALAFRRGAEEYRSCHLVELPCPDWAEALARHWYYDEAEALRWTALAGSADERLATLPVRPEREETYHRRHARALVGHLLEGRSPDAAERLRIAIDRLLPLADAIWDPVAGEDAALAAGLVTRSSGELQAEWRRTVDFTIGVVDWGQLVRPAQAHRTRRSDHFAALHARINEVFTLDPTARW